MEAIDTVKQKIALLESSDQRLGMSNILYSLLVTRMSACVYETSQYLARWRVTAVQDKLWSNLVAVKQRSMIFWLLRQKL